MPGPPAQTHAPVPPAPAPALGRQAFAGTLWLSMVAVSAKVLGLVGQLLLAYILGRQEFGAVGLAYTVAVFAGIPQQAGLREILTQRHARFRRWANAAFWMALALGAASAALTAGFGPLAARVLRTPELPGLLLVLALRNVCDSFAVVPTAALQAQLRFRTLALLAVAATTITTGLSIVFAVIGWGPYAFVAPVAIVSAAQAAILWLIQPPPVRWQLQWRRWRYLTKDAALLLGTAFAASIGGYGDYLILGLFHDRDEVGVYFFAFGLSMLTAQLVASSLSGVLFPTFARLQQEPQRQIAAFLRACRTLAVLATPLCLLQAIVGDSLIHLLYRGRWSTAIPAFQILSVATAFGVIGTILASFMKARGQFGLYFRTAASLAVCFLSLVAAGAWLGGATSVALAVTVHHVVTGPVVFYGLLHPLGARPRDVWDVFGLPLLVSGLALAPAAAVAYLVPAIRGSDLAYVLTAGVLGIALYVPLARWLSPQPVADLQARIGDLWQRRARRAA